MSEDIRHLKQFLSIPKEIAIITHRNPDGDAMGSSLGLAEYLLLLHHSVKVIFPSEYPQSFKYMKGIQNVIIFDLEHDMARKTLDKADIIFCLDFNGLDRVDKLGEIIQFSKAKKILVDHHLDPEPFCDLEFSDIGASSTCELIFKLIDELGDRHKISSEIGECLFTGLITDTGSFRYGTRPYTYEVAAALKTLGVDDYRLADKIFNSQKESVKPLWFAT